MLTGHGAAERPRVRDLPGDGFRVLLGESVAAALTLVPILTSAPQPPR